MTTFIEVAKQARNRRAEVRIVHNHGDVVFGRVVGVGPKGITLVPRGSFRFETIYVASIESIDPTADIRRTA